MNIHDTRFPATLAQLEQRDDEADRGGEERLGDAGRDEAAAGNLAEAGVDAQHGVDAQASASNVADIKDDAADEDHDGHEPAQAGQHGIDPNARRRELDGEGLPELDIEFADRHVVVVTADEVDAGVERFTRAVHRVCDGAA